MVPDAGFVLGQLKYSEVESEAIDGLDIALEFQRFNLECNDGPSFRKVVSATRSKMQRWAASSTDDVITVAQAALQAVKFAAEMEGLEHAWVESLAMYVAKQVSALKLPTGVWHKDRNVDLEQAVNLFVGLKEAEVLSAVERTHAQQLLALSKTASLEQSQSTFDLWSGLPLSFSEEWKGPSKKIPYPAFKARIQKVFVLYGSPDRAAQYFLIRNLGDALREEVEDLVNPEESAALCLKLMWEYLDGKYANTFSLNESLSRWEALKQRSDESIADFCARLDVEAKLLQSLGYHELSGADRALRLRSGMNAKLHLHMRRYMGPKFKTVDYAKLRKNAEHNEEDLEQENVLQGTNPRRSPRKDSATTEAPVNKPIKCSRCLRVGHLMRYCRSKSPGDYANRCHVCGMRSHPTSKCPQTNPKCDACGKHGHLIYVCPFPVALSTTKPVTKNITAVDADDSEQKPTNKDPVLRIKQDSSASVDAVDILNVDKHTIDASWSVKLAPHPNICSVVIEDSTYYGLVDSGSSVALIRASVVDKLIKDGCKISMYPIREVSAVYADGSKRKLNRETLMNCSIGERSFILPFLVVDHLSYDIILGRSVLGMIGTQIEYYYGTPDDSCKLQRRLQDAFNANVQHAAAEHSTPTSSDACDSPVSKPGEHEAHHDEAAKDLAHIQIVGSDVIECNGLSLNCSILNSIADDDLAISDYVDRDEVSDSLPNIPPKPDTKPAVTSFRSIEEALEKLSVAGWQPVPNATDYCYALKKLEDLEDSTPDTPNQKYRFIFDWAYENPEQKTKSWSPDYLLAKLSDEQRVLWFKELDMYVAKQWWQPFDGVRPPDALVAFPVIATNPTKTTQVRPVIDARAKNSRSPRASNKKRDVCSVINHLRSSLKPGFVAKQYDLAKAFYRLAISTPVIIDFGKNPETGSNVMMRCSRLAFGLSIGPSGLECSLDLLFNILQFFHPNVTCVRIMDDIVAVGLPDDLCAFEKGLLHILDLCGFDIPLHKMNTWSGTNWSKWLCCDWKWDTNHLTVRVPRIAFNEVFTKRQAFSEAGKFLRLCESIPEAQSRGHADIVRKLSGQLAEDWDDRLSTSTARLVNLHLEAATVAWSLISDEVPLYSSTSKMLISHDASKDAYASIRYDCTSSPRIVLGAQTHLFPNTAIAWHANRRELYCIAASLMSLLYSIDEGCYPILSHVTIMSDSNIAISRLDNKPHHSKGVEWLALVRLRECCMDVIDVLKAKGIVVRTSHCSASRNQQADALSRLINDVPAANVAALEDPFEALSSAEEGESTSATNLAADAIEIFDYDYPLSVFDSLSNSIPCLSDFCVKLQTFRAWKGGEALSPRDVSHRFIVSEQSKDPLCVEALELLTSKERLDRITVSQRDITPAVKGFMPGLVIQEGQANAKVTPGSLVSHARRHRLPPDPLANVEHT